VSIELFAERASSKKQASQGYQETDFDQVEEGVRWLDLVKRGGEEIDSRRCH